MLEEVRIRSLGVIRDAVLELGAGFTAVTGETGAGKTMVVTGLGLLLGARADAGTVRAGDSQALVEGRVVVEADGPVSRRARDAGAELDEAVAPPAPPGACELLLMSRSVAAQGGSRAHLGGRSVPVGVLAEVADLLVAVHGQSGQLRLRSAAAQREMLDRFAGPALSAPLGRYRQAYQRLRQVEATLEELRTRADERSREAELLRLGLEEIERVAPRHGEDVELRRESDRLAHAEELARAAGTAHAALLGDPASGQDAVDVASLLATAKRAVDQVSEHDPALAALAGRLGEVAYAVSDIGSDLAGYAAGVESDPARLSAIQDRQAVLTALTRAHGGDVAAVLAWSEQAVRRVLELEGDDDRLAGLAAEREELLAVLDREGADVTAVRQEAAERLSAQVTAELTGLAMSGAVLLARVQPRPAHGPNGMDEVELTLQPHSGAPARPVARGASGGELSRVMLAVEVVLAGADPVPTFVFDEVDAGVGGAAAVEVGRRLARLARTSQVLVVTHLPQVAAFADRHLQVVKSDDGEVTESGVRTLHGEDRVRELARMLAGQADSGSARAHAQELLADARAECT